MIFSRAQYALFFGLLALVYILGLFVPLMDNDSAHHANIALRMYLTGDYVSLVDNGKDYLDKPHLHFWLAALSYSVFGVTGFAYKFPSFLFTLLGTYSTYRLGRTLYTTEVGRLSALVVASAFAYMLANNDVRMDAILTACVAFATWQLVEWVNGKKLLNVIGAALGLALGFCTKGHIAVLTPGIGILFYILYKKDWRSFYHWHLLLLVFFFGLFISPVVYCYYLQYDLHPEKIIRGKGGRSGVQFILWKQNFERFQGDSFGADAKNDYFFFFHSFLWAFAPWSVLAFVAFINRIKTFFTRRQEWLTTATFATMALLITFSGFKLPHYLNIMFPAAAVLTASYLLEAEQKRRNVKALLVTQVVLCGLLLLLAGAMNVWAFPAKNGFVIGGFLLLLALCVFVLLRLHSRLQKIVGASVVAILLLFYLLNTNFYPQLLRYQAGNELAFATKGQVDAKRVWFWPAVYSSSYCFYTAELRKEFTDSVLHQPSPVWIMTDNNGFNELKQKGLPVLQTIQHADYEITMLQLPFLNPAARQKELSRMLLVRVK
jgi:4-amino-4-deoxy-L-arabinose transferase-like glycosyltransferase